MNKIGIASATKREFPNYISAFKALGVDLIYLDDADFSCDEYAGVIMPGGGDIDPALYGKENAGSIDPERDFDELQIKILDKFVKAKKPILGICRGEQLLNVYFGGTLIQNLKNVDVHGHTTPDNVHPIDIKDDSFLKNIYGKKAIVNSSHHQAIDLLGKGLKVEAECAGIVEAISHESLPIIAVQFHPERMCFEFASDRYDDGSKLLKYFLSMVNGGQR